MKPIPISAAKRIADEYGYHQVVIYARKVDPAGGEHMTTYGTTKEHCGIAARMATTLQKFMGWKPETAKAD
jgi:hypothetical protein